MSRNKRGGQLDVIAFPGPTGAILKEVTSYSNVTFRQTDGRHVMLYSGHRGERPCKVSAMSSPETVVPRVEEWAERHVKGWRADG